jgi:hypothetical protein
MLGGLSSSELHTIATKGSPTVLHVVGRAFGLGQTERDALARGAFPAWLWIVLGGVVGVAVGVQVQKRWPRQVTKLTGGM